MPDEPMPFREWMSRALFDPERGYYARQIRTVGRRGETTAGLGANTKSKILCNDNCIAEYTPSSPSHKPPHQFTMGSVGADDISDAPITVLITGFGVRN